MRYRSRHPINAQAIRARRSANGICTNANGEQASTARTEYEQVEYVRKEYVRMEDVQMGDVQTEYARICASERARGAYKNRENMSNKASPERCVCVDRGEISESRIFMGLLPESIRTRCYLFGVCSCRRCAAAIL